MAGTREPRRKAGRPFFDTCASLSLTQNLVQLHNRRVGADALHRLGLLGRVALLKHLLILVAGAVGGSHGGSIAVGFGRQLLEGGGNSEGAGRWAVRN